MDRLDLNRGAGRQEENAPPRERIREAPRRARNYANVSSDEYEAAFAADTEDDSFVNPRRPRRGARARERLDDDTSQIKLEIPSFTGRNDAEAFLEWARKTEMVFDCHRYSEEKKVKLAAAKFSHYALVWWDQLIISRRRNGEEPITTWQEMKAIMRRRFVPSHYHRDVHQRLRRLVQGSMGVEEYYKEMEMLMIRAQVDEEREATMQRFLCGLNQDIQDDVDSRHYVELEDLLHLAIKSERRLKRKGKATFRFGQSSSGTRFEQSKVEESSSLNKTEMKLETTKPRVQGNTDNSTVRNRDIKFFKCHGTGHYARDCGNKRAMIMRGDGELETEGEESDGNDEVAENSSSDIEDVVTAT